MATTPDKDTIYVDIDDEITGVIDKVKGSSAKVVALVLPKRASVFQSIVNMKLLKRASDASSKSLVLITSEAGLLPLAGAAGIHVAKTLSTKPEIPTAPKLFEDNDEAVDENEQLPSDQTEALDPKEPVGKLAGDKAPPKSATGEVETIALNNEEPEDEAKDEAKDKTDKTDKPPKKNKAFKIPNFNRFRLMLFIGLVAIILLIILFIILNSALGSATINISTNATNVPTSLNLNLSANATTLETNNNTIPAKMDQEQKTYSQQVPTTGQKNEGNEASGTMTVSGGACSGNIPADIPAGSGASANNLTYITQDDISFVPTGSHGQCTFEGVDANSNQPEIPITAQSGGSNYNVSGVPFTIDGYSGNGSASGGTDNNVQVVNQNDINNAKSKISSNDSGIKQALQSQLQGEGYYAITATYTPGTPSVTNSANVGDAASTVTVTETINYTMFGVHSSDLKTLIDTSVDGQINTAKQSILDDGLSQAVFNPNNLTSNGGQVNMTTTAVAGPQLDIASIKQNAEGKKAGDISSQLLVDPDVTGVKVSFSPFWVSSAPHNASKITVKIAKPAATK